MGNLFAATNPFGQIVRCSEHRWEKHIVAGHPSMRNKVDSVIGAIENPSSIWESGTHPKTRDVYFSHKSSDDAYTKVIVEGESVVSAWIQREVKGNIGELKYVNV